MKMNKVRGEESGAGMQEPECRMRQRIHLFSNFDSLNFDLDG